MNCILFTKQNWQIGIRAEAAVNCQSYRRNTIAYDAATWESNYFAIRSSCALPIFPYTWNSKFDSTFLIHWQLLIDICVYINFEIFFLLSFHCFLFVLDFYLFGRVRMFIVPNWRCQTCIYWYFCIWVA